MSARTDKIREIIVYLVIIFLPVMSIVNLFGKVKINVALSDLFAAMIVLLTIVDYKSFSLRKNFPYWWYFAGLMGLMIISNTLAYFNPNIATGSILSAVNEFIKFVIAGVYFYIGYSCPEDKGKLIKALRVWTYTALAVSIIGIVTILINKQLRLTGTITDPNLAAAYFGVSFYISMLFINLTTTKIDRYTGIISLIATTAAIVLTQSRSGIIAFAASLALYGAVNIKKIYRYITLILLIVFIGYFGVLNLDAVYFNKQLTTSMNKRFEDVTEGKGEADRREYLAKAAYLMGKDHFLTGVGRGNYLFNNDSYFEEIGIDIDSDYYKDYLKTFIPHNTYMTFFAELGIPGLILFLFLFYKVIRQNFKLNYANILMLCMIGYYLVQAIAVNLENFRGIWFILGISLIYGSKLEIPEKIREYKAPGLSTKKILAINITLFILGIFVYLNAVPYYTNPVLLDRELQSQDITNLESNEKYVFRYHIKTETEDISKPTSKISIYGVDKDSKEVLLNQITHFAPNGYGILEFVPDENIISVRIKAEPLDIRNSVININEAAIINTHTGEGQKLFAEYKYIPNSIEHFMTNAGLVSDSVIVDTESLNLFADKMIYSEAAANYIEKDGPVFFDGSNTINLSNKILFLGSRLEQQSTGQAKLSLLFKCIGEMDVDYNIWFHAITIDKGILSNERRKYGFENWDHSLEVRTTEWKVGKTYEHTYIIDIIPGQYDLSFGFWNSKWKDGKAYRLYPGIDLGNIQIK